MQDLVANSARLLGAPAPTRQETTDALNRARSAVENTPDGRIILGQPIGAADREVLRRRNDELSAALDRRNATTIATAITTMYRAYAPNLTDAEAVQRMKAYGEAMMAFPAWAVHAVCTRYAAGLVAGRNNAFAPTIAELAAACQEEIRPWVGERNQILETLTAKAREVPRRTPESIARVDALVADFKRGATSTAQQTVGPHTGKPLHPYIEKYHATRAQALGELGPSQALKDLLASQGKASA